MKITIPLSAIPTSLNPQIQTIVDNTNKKLKKDKKPSIQANDLTWAYEWASLLNGKQNNPLNTLFLSLSGTLGQRQTSAPFPQTNSPNNQPTPKKLIPKEIIDFYKPKPTVTINYPHCAKFFLYNPNTKQTQTVLATGGYTKQSKNYIHFVTINEEIINEKAFEIILYIHENTAQWYGSLVPKAKSRYEKTPEGQSFSYRNAKFQRMTTQNVKELVENKTFTLTL